MKIAIIGPGIMPILEPEKAGWGAVEALIWDYKFYLEKHSHEVLIINTKDFNQAYAEASNFNPDVIHIQYDDHADWAKELMKICTKVYITSHYGYIHQPFRFAGDGYHIMFQKFIDSPAKILALSEESKNLYIRYGKKPKDVHLVHNGASVDKFKFSLNPIYPNRSIYLAKLTTRKRQNLLYSFDDIDFVGNQDGTIPSPPSSQYLGEWNKKYIYDHLTDYANLILLSDGEAHALVIVEALAAGLGLVVSEHSKANLDTMPFIDVIPESKINDLNYVKQTIVDNREKSLNFRSEIRDYALNKFYWDKIVRDYINIVKQ